LVGVYSGDILVTEFENYIKIAVYIELFPEEVGKKQAEVLISYLGHDVAKIAGEFEYKDLSAPANVVSPTLPLKLERPGQIVITIVCEGKKKRAAVKEIRLASSEVFTASNAPAPPPSQSQSGVSQSSSRPALSRRARHA